MASSSESACAAARHSIVPYGAHSHHHHVWRHQAQPLVFLLKSSCRRGMAIVADRMLPRRRLKWHQRLQACAATLLLFWLKLINNLAGVIWAGNFVAALDEAAILLLDDVAC